VARPANPKDYTRPPGLRQRDDAGTILTRTKCPGGAGGPEKRMMNRTARRIQILFVIFSDLCPGA